MNHKPSLLAQANPFACPLPDTLSSKKALSTLVNTVEAREPKLIGHGARTAWYSLQLGGALHLPDQELEHLMYAAYLHDVGKLSVPEEILVKEDPLSSHEFYQFQSHPSAAITLLESWTFLRVPSIWIAHHHERWDGSGYPNGLKGTYIPLGSRIIAIADTYDVLTLRNPGGPETAADVCLSILRWYSGSHFDPELIDTFSKLVPEWASSKGRIHDVDSLHSAKLSRDGAPLHDGGKESIRDGISLGGLAKSFSLKP
jgi:HD-GYP domain-containing protein (c-di-GMP phosphodiesterase class II)